MAQEKLKISMPEMIFEEKKHFTLLRNWNGTLLKQRYTTIR